MEQAEFLAKTFSLPVVASNEPLFHARERKPLQDVLTAIRHSTPLSETGLKCLPNAERFLKSPEEIADLFPTHPEWLENTLEIKEGCDFSLDEIRYQYPTEWLPPGETGDSYLAKLSLEGALHRYPKGIPEAAHLQIEKELELIRELRYSDYFLTIWDIVEFAKSKGIHCQGRGSAANSIVCYVLGITAIDPVRLDLPL